jgi:2-hydroxychromene-2-carboxylate isomerase
VNYGGRVLSAVWAEERNIADVDTLKLMLTECGLPITRYEESLTESIQALYDADTQTAIDTQVFGSPTFVIEGELFWGQDRLDFVERKLAA